VLQSGNKFRIYSGLLQRKDVSAVATGLPRDGWLGQRRQRERESACPQLQARSATGYRSESAVGIPTAQAAVCNHPW